jgi:ubiquinone/menaquinone biosynthesis C-methylase UbiE
MTHTDHVFLLQKAAIKPGQIWADFGSGDGAFTLALRDLGGPNIQIYSIDQDQGRLKTQKQNFEEIFPDSNITFIQQDFTKPLDLQLLDGILMANSLHYIYDKKTFLKNLKKYLKPQGILLIVEYNSDIGNMWVPSPVSSQNLANLLKDVGFINPQKLAAVPSDFLSEIYSLQAHTTL